VELVQASVATAVKQTDLLRLIQQDNLTRVKAEEQTAIRHSLLKLAVQA